MFLLKYTERTAVKTKMYQHSFQISMIYFSKKKLIPYENKKHKRHFLPYQQRGKTGSHLILSLYNKKKSGKRHHNLPWKTIPSSLRPIYPFPRRTFPVFRSNPYRSRTILRPSWVSWNINEGHVKKMAYFTFRRSSTNHRFTFTWLERWELERKIRETKWF